MAKPLKTLLAYSLGQLTTIGVLWVAIANNLYLYRLIPFCVIADVIITGAVLIGTLIAEAPAYNGAHEEKEEEIGMKPHKPFIQYVMELAEKGDEDEDEQV